MEGPAWDNGSPFLAGRADVRVTGDEPTLETGEYSLGVVVRGVEAAEAEADDEADER